MKDSPLLGDSEGLDNSPFTPVRGRALSDLLTSQDKHRSDLPVLEPIKIRSTENAEDESSESEPEDEENFEVTNDSDSEPEADRDIKRTGSEIDSDGKKNHLENNCGLKDTNSNYGLTSLVGCFQLFNLESLCFFDHHTHFYNLYCIYFIL